MPPLPPYDDRCPDEATGPDSELSPVGPPHLPSTPPSSSPWLESSSGDPMEWYVRDYSRHELIPLGIPSGTHVSSGVVRSSSSIDSTSRDDNTRRPSTSDSTASQSGLVESPRQMGNGFRQAVHDSGSESMASSDATFGSTTTSQPPAMQGAMGSPDPSTDEAHVDDPMDLDRDQEVDPVVDPRTDGRSQAAYVSVMLSRRVLLLRMAWLTV